MEESPNRGNPGDLITQQPDPQTEKQQLVAGEWYKTQEDRFVRLLFEDKNLDKFIGQLDARELCYDADGKAYYLASEGVIDAPSIYHIQDLKPVPEPPVREYMLHININASVLMKGRSIQEVIALIPDMIDLEALDNDVQVRDFNIKVGNGHLIHSKK